MDNQAQARMAQLEAGGAGSSDGWAGVNKHNTVGNNPAANQSRGVVEATNQINGVYVDRHGMQHNVDSEGNPIATVESNNRLEADTATPVDSGTGTDTDEGQAISYVKMQAASNPALTEKNIQAGFESGNGKDMTYAINQMIAGKYAAQIDAHKSNPTAVWDDIRKFSKEHIPSAQRQSFNDVMANGSGQDRQAEIQSLINKYHTFYGL